MTCREHCGVTLAQLKVRASWIRGVEMRRGLVVALVALGVALPAVAQEQPKRVGSWEIRASKDRFAGEQKVTASRIADGWIMALRCFPSGLSIVLLDRFGVRFEEGQDVAVQFRADSKSIIKTEGVALGRDIIQIDDSDVIIADMKGAREFAFRISLTATNFDVVIPSGKGADAAIKIVTDACSSR